MGGDGVVAAGTTEYLRNQVLTASPEQLQMMLYDGAIRFARQGREAIERRDLEASYHLLTRAQRIVLEMLNGLQHEVNPQLCDKMAGLYTFIYRRLVDASVQKDTRPCDEALRILEYQRETWALFLDRLAQERGQISQTVTSEPAEPGPLNIEFEG
jgi:flagellar protein FliS